MIFSFLKESYHQHARQVSSLALKEDKLSLYVQLLRVEVDNQKNDICLAEHLKKSHDHLFDVFEIQKAPLSAF